MYQRKKNTPKLKQLEQKLFRSKAIPERDVRVCSSPAEEWGHKVPWKKALIVSVTDRQHSSCALNRALPDPRRC